MVRRKLGRIGKEPRYLSFISNLNKWLSFKKKKKPRLNFHSKCGRTLKKKNLICSSPFSEEDFPAEVENPPGPATFWKQAITSANSCSSNSQEDRSPLPSGRQSSAAHFPRRLTVHTIAPSFTHSAHACRAGASKTRPANRPESPGA